MKILTLTNYLRLHDATGDMYPAPACRGSGTSRTDIQYL